MAEPLPRVPRVSDPRLRRFVQRMASGEGVPLATNGGLEVVSGLMQINDGDGIAINGSNEVIVDLAATSGLEFTAGKLRLDLQAPGAGTGGLEFSGNELRLDVGDGLELTANGLAVNLAPTAGTAGPGLQFISGELSILAAPGRGIRRDDTGVAINNSGDSTYLQIHDSGGNDEAFVFVVDNTPRLWIARSQADIDGDGLDPWGVAYTSQEINAVVIRTFDLVIDNEKALLGRNAGNTANVFLAKVNSSNQPQLGQAAPEVVVWANNTEVAKFDAVNNVLDLSDLRLGLDNNSPVRLRDTGGTYRDVLTMTTSNVVQVANAIGQLQYSMGTAGSAADVNWIRGGVQTMIATGNVAATENELIIGQTTNHVTGANNCITLETGDVPASGSIDKLFFAGHDFDNVAGRNCPHFRTEEGHLIRLRRINSYTQTFTAADRTVNAYTSDSESAAYSGIDNAQGGTPYAQVSDLNQLRVAYENLRAMAEDVQQALTALIDDLQSVGVVG